MEVVYERCCGLTPGQYESGGKHHGRGTRPGNRYLKAAVTEAAQAAGHSTDPAVGERHKRLVRRMGRKKAAIATGQQLLVLASTLLTTGQPYDPAKARAKPARDPQAEARRLIRRLEQLGHKVTLEPVAAD